MRYKTLSEGECRTLKGRRGRFAHKVMCCDCGLVHMMAMKFHSGTRMTFAAWRDNRATAATRSRRPRAHK